MQHYFQPEIEQMPVEQIRAFGQTGAPRIRQRAVLPQKDGRTGRNAGRHSWH